MKDRCSRAGDKIKETQCIKESSERSRTSRDGKRGKQSQLTGVWNKLRNRRTKRGLQHKTSRCEGEKLNARAKSKGEGGTAYNQAGLGRAFTVIDGSLRNALVDFEDGKGPMFEYDFPWPRS